MSWRWRAMRKMEFERNRERYEFLRWGAKAFNNLRVVPPATGIVHQVNLEYLAQGVLLQRRRRIPRYARRHRLAHDDGQRPGRVGLGRGRHRSGSRDAGPAALHGHAASRSASSCIGNLREGVTATDLVLTVTQMLRKKGVVDKFVEFYGPGLSSMSLPDRATIANMAPDYGATCGFFPDRRRDAALPAPHRSRPSRPTCVEALRQSARAVPHRRHARSRVHRHARARPGRRSSRRWPAPSARKIACRSRDLKASFRKSLDCAGQGSRLWSVRKRPGQKVAIESDPIRNPHPKSEIGHGAVVIAAITSCTNTSNPSVMLGAGLLAKKAVEARADASSPTSRPASRPAPRS